MWLWEGSSGKRGTIKSRQPQVSALYCVTRNINFKHEVLNFSSDTHCWPLTYKSAKAFLHWALCLLNPCCLIAQVHKLIQNSVKHNKTRTSWMCNFQASCATIPVIKAHYLSVSILGCWIVTHLAWLCTEEEPTLEQIRITCMFLV